MQTFRFTIFFLLTCASSSSLSYAFTLSRRHLYNDDLADLTPPEPLPPNPPFFPVDSSFLPPPPPPPASVFPTFPANISALVLPTSPKSHSTSPTVIVPVLSAVLAVATALGFALFLYGRWHGQNRHFNHLKEDNSTSSYEEDEEEEEEEHIHITTSNNNNNNFSVAATTSPSEVFYLSPHESEGGTCFVKLDSPEIRPLPPLPLYSFHMNYEAEKNQEEDEDEEEEDEDEFFSPLASFAGSLNASPSRSCSSGCVSPARSLSITLSPPQCSNPRFSDVSFDQNLQSSPYLSNPRFSDVSFDQNLQSSPYLSNPRFSDVSFDQKLQSSPYPSNPRLSNVSWDQTLSPERLKVRKNYGNGSSSLRMFSFWKQNLGFPRISSASTSPERGCTIRTPLSSLYSSVSNSPDGFFRKFLDSSPPIWNDFSRNVKSVLLSSDSVSSRRDFVINIAESSIPPPTRPPPLVPTSQPFVAPELRKSSLQKAAWDCLKSSSFKLNKEIVETLFIANSSNQNIKQRSLSYDLQNQVLDPKKAQNIASLLQLNLTTKDISQALLDGDCDALGVELLECLSRSAPSEDEEKKLMSYSDDDPKLGLPERFLKELLHVPLVFKRVDALLFVANFNSEIEQLRGSFCVVQAASEELRNSIMFSILMGAVLKAGNRMEVSDSQACKLDRLLKLAEVKGLDERSSLLRFVLQEMTKPDATVRVSLEAIRYLNSELENVKKSADMEFGVLRSNVLKLHQGIKNIEELLLLSEESGDQWLKFGETMARFLETAAEEILKIKAQESSTVSALKEVTEQFHGDTSKEGHTLRIFMIVRDFLSILEKVCNEIGDRFQA